METAEATKTAKQQEVKKQEIKKPEFEKFDDVSLLSSTKEEDEFYPYSDLDVGEAFFVPVEPNHTTHELLIKMHKDVEQTKQRYGEIEVTEDGDEIWEVLTVRTRERNADGTIKLVDNKPILGADYLQRPKYIYTRNFIVKEVKKDQDYSKGNKFDADGVLVIRVA